VEEFSCDCVVFVNPDQGQSKRALAAFMPARCPALYTRLNAKATRAIITIDDPVLPTESQRLQSAVISISNTDISTTLLRMHAKVQTKVGALRSCAGNPRGDRMQTGRSSGGCVFGIPWNWALPGFFVPGEARTGPSEHPCEHEHHAEYRREDYDGGRWL